MTYLPCFAPMSPRFDSRSQHLRALGFQSKLVSVGFPWVPPVFLLAPETGLSQVNLFSGCFMELSLKFNAYALGISLAFHQML